MGEPKTGFQCFTRKVHIFFVEERGGATCVKLGSCFSRFFSTKGVRWCILFPLEVANSSWFIIVFYHSLYDTLKAIIWWFFEIAPQNFGRLWVRRCFIHLSSGSSPPRRPQSSPQHLGWAFHFSNGSTGIFGAEKKHVSTYIQTVNIPCTSLDYFCIHKTTEVITPHFLPKNVASRKSCHPFHHHQHQASQERSLRLERMREFQEFERQQAEQEARHHKSDSATYHPGQISSRPITTSWEIPKFMVIV